MMTPDMMARNIANAFLLCRRRSQLSVESLAELLSCDIALIERIENADCDECFQIRENYNDKESVQRRMCDAIKLTPAICLELDDGIIF
jgi:hypothetical protein